MSGFFGLFFVFGAFLVMLVAVPLVVFWERDRWIFKGSPFWSMFFLVPIWFCMLIWQGLFYAD